MRLWAGLLAVLLALLPAVGRPALAGGLLPLDLGVGGIGVSIDPGGLGVGGGGLTVNGPDGEPLITITLPTLVVGNPAEPSGGEPPSPPDNSKPPSPPTGDQKPGPPGQSGGWGRSGGSCQGVTEVRVAVGPEAARIDAFCGELVVTIEPGTFSRPDYLVIKKSGGEPLPLVGLASPGDGKPLFVLSQVTPLYELTAGQEVPQKPVRLLVRYDERRLGDAQPEKLGLYRRDGPEGLMWRYEGGRWESESGAVEAALRSWGRVSVLLHDRSFGDIRTHWARRQIELLASRHVVAGVTGVEFRPDAPLTRAQAAKLVTEMMARNPDASLRRLRPAQPTFRDVKPKDWFYPYVETAAARGVLRGYAGFFRPGDPVTREELAAMMLRALGWEPEEGTPREFPFRDAQAVSPWARAYVAAAWERGLFNGLTATVFGPRAGATRGQAAAVVVRAMDRAGWITVPVVLNGLLALDSQGGGFELGLAGRPERLALMAAYGDLKRVLRLWAGQRVRIAGYWQKGPRGRVFRIISVRPLSAEDR